METLVGLCRRWPVWVARVTQYWAVLYGALAVHWMAGGRASFPIANVHGDPPGGPVAAVVVGGVLALGSTVGLVSARGTSRWATAGLVFATGTTLLGTFGLALSGVGVVAAGTVERPWAMAGQVVAAVGAGLLFASTQVQVRRRRSRCPRCGGAHQLALRPGAALVRPRLRPASARTRRTAYLVLAGLLPWASVKLFWGFGGSALGVTAAEWRTSMGNSEMSALSRLLERFGIDITVLASLVGVLLVLALLYRWGLHLPRWLLLLPAWIGGVSLLLYGVPLAVWGSLMATGVTPADGDPSPFTATGIAYMVLFGGVAFGGLGTALAVGAVSYQRRSQPHC